ncbi:tRNA preQ1(34) S-adenosylmethionine ribosyltransferase-isomerase QueA [Candidatus Uhrbacteria bacterium]|nr:tRNA preQ1(34) S-adenosylmethionine ribosyltransferase-isomerase QueA [Candidatus Uhrbacteria bacterium]
MNTSDFDYKLPPEQIAQSPIEPRDHSKLLVLDKANKTWNHQHFYNIDRFLRPGDLLVINESKVFKARLSANINNTTVEIFLLRPEDDLWIALGKPGKKIKPNTEIHFQDGLSATIIKKNDQDGTILIDFKVPANEIFSWTDKIGSVPTPPYVVASEQNDAAYQTVYAKQIGSVAAPTAGFHFTPELIQKLKKQGINFTNITLHVGLGTFRPMKNELIEQHVMHKEWINVPDKTIHDIKQTRAHGGRVIAVGTTTVRALESKIQQGLTDIFITPGYTFKNIDGLITNFHLPKSTLLVLVSSFAGRDFILNAYAEAIKEKYRFYSFGDAMLII